MIPDEETINKEIKLLALWGKIGNGYSKTFREEWAKRNLPERLQWLKETVTEGIIELEFSSDVRLNDLLLELNALF